MKQAQNARKQRGRPAQRKGGRSNNNNGNRFDNRSRGNPKQLLEKYKTQARDSLQAGDRVNAEYFLQFADHYQRLVNEQQNNQNNNQNNQASGQGGEEKGRQQSRREHGQRNQQNGSGTEELATKPNNDAGIEGTNDTGPQLADVKASPEPKADVAQVNAGADQGKTGDNDNKQSAPRPRRRRAVKPKAEESTATAEPGLTARKSQGAGTPASDEPV